MEAPRAPEPSPERRSVLRHGHVVFVGEHHGLVAARTAEDPEPPPFPLRIVIGGVVIGPVLDHLTPTPVGMPMVDAIGHFDDSGLGVHWSPRGDARPPILTLPDRLSQPDSELDLINRPRREMAW